MSLHLFAPAPVSSFYVYLGADSRFIGKLCRRLFECLAVRLSLPGRSLLRMPPQFSRTVGGMSSC